MVTRTDWKALESKQPIGDLAVIPPKIVVVASTDGPTCSTKLQCSSIVKNIQISDMADGAADIRVNFLIGGDNLVYEGLGWNKTGNHTHNYNDVSIGLAFIGSFMTSPPPQSQVDVGLNWLEESVTSGNLDPKYVVYVQKQLTPYESPGVLMIPYIKEWTHWSDNEGEKLIAYVEMKAGGTTTDVESHIEKLMRCEKLRESQVKDLCSRAKEIIAKDANLLILTTPITICGDIHGQLPDLVELFSVGGSIPWTTYLFLGDYVDRGYNSIETYLLLLALKVRYPTRIHLIRGNHESREITQVYGFYDEVLRKYGSITVWKHCIETFNVLSLGAVIDGKVFCVHGGLSPTIEAFDDIKGIDRNQDVPHSGSMTDLLWSDPDEQNGWGMSPRGAGFIYGPDVVDRFRMQNGVEFIARAHQLVLEGYKWHFRNTVVTVWSAPNYCYRCGNVASILEMEPNNEFFTIFEAAPQVKKLFYT